MSIRKIKRREGKLFHKQQDSGGTLRGGCAFVHNQDTPSRGEAVSAVSAGSSFQERTGRHHESLLCTRQGPHHLNAYHRGFQRAPGPLKEAPSAQGDPLCSRTADTHTAADSQPQRGSEDQGTSRSSRFNCGKTQCSLHSNVAKWCRDPLALGSPIQRGTSHTALPLPTARFCV